MSLKAVVNDPVSDGSEDSRYTKETALSYGDRVLVDDCGMEG